MKKRIIALFLAAVMAFSFVACGKKEEEPKDLGVTLGQYKGIEAKKTVTKITDEDVTSNIYVNLKKTAEEVAIKDRDTVQLYDIVNIDYVGKLNGEAFSGGTAEGTDLMIGSGTFIPGFEEAIIGHKVGSVFDIDVTFPENYGSADLAGKAVVFSITLNKISAVPELTDELIAANTTSKTLEEYTASIRKSLEDNAEETAQNQFESDVIDAVIKNATFSDTLQTDADAYAKDLRQYYEDYAKAYNTTLEIFLYYFYGITLEYFESTLPAASLYSVQCERIYAAVAQAENLTISDEEYKAYVEQMMIDYKLESVAAVEEAYGADLIKEEMLNTKAREIIINSAIAK